MKQRIPQIMPKMSPEYSCDDSNCVLGVRNILKTTNGHHKHKCCLQGAIYNTVEATLSNTHMGKKSLIEWIKKLNQ